MAEDTGLHNITSMQDYLDAKKQPGAMIIDCFAVWCGPCKVIAPKFLELSKTFEKARFYKLDVDEVPDVAQELGVRAMPTFVVFRDSEKVDEVVGGNPKALEAAIAAVAV